MRVFGCGSVRAPRGRDAGLGTRPALFTPYVLRMRSGAGDDGRPRPGSVVSAGTATRGGREGIQLKLDTPARLVLAESYNRGRRATCDGQDLGAPEVGGIYGTAWRVPKTCTDVEISFAPNRLVNAGYALSLLVGLLLLAFVADPPARRAGPSRRAREPRRHARCRQGGRRCSRPVGLAFGFVFAARATPLFALGVFLVLWRGVDARELALAGGRGPGVAVPILTS